MSGHDINLPLLKKEILNELKPLMMECVEGWLSNQKDTLLIQLVGMIEQEKYEIAHRGEQLPPSKPITYIKEGHPEPNPDENIRVMSKELI